MIEFVSLQSSDMSNVGDMSVQEKYASSSICFGCGPANLKGLRIRSFRSEDGLIMEFDTLPEHQAFPGMVNGGIIGTLLDCHGNWAAAIAIMDSFVAFGISALAHIVIISGLFITFLIFNEADGFLKICSL